MSKNKWVKLDHVSRSSIIFWFRPRSRCGSGKDKSFCTYLNLNENIWDMCPLIVYNCLYFDPFLAASHLFRYCAAAVPLNSFKASDWTCWYLLQVLSHCLSLYSFGPFPPMILKHSNPVGSSVQHLHLYHLLCDDISKMLEQSLTSGRTRAVTGYTLRLTLLLRQNPPEVC